jgi:hypothetical protein
MSTPSSAFPPPAQGPATQVVGQQSAPSTAVPVGGTPQQTALAIGGRKINSLAVISFVTALLAPFGHVTAIGGLALTIISIVTGHMARAEIKKTGEDGATFALIGLIISYVHIAVTILIVIFLFSAIIAFFTFILHAVTTSG